MVTSGLRMLPRTMFVSMFQLPQLGSASMFMAVVLPDHKDVRDWTAT